MKDYKKILEGIVDIINTTEKSDIGFVEICDYIGEHCPELKESEDERIRKDMIFWLKGFIGEASGVGYTEDEIKERIAYLEKQGKKKPTDVELRFKVDDWVVNKYGYVWHVDSFDKKNCQVSNSEGDDCYFKISKQDDFHLWTIDDAKDGDVLCTYECCEPKIVFILKGT